MEEQSVYETDKLRQTLASEGKLVELGKTYDGSFPDLPSMNNGKKWDFRAINAPRMIGDKLDPHSRTRIAAIAKLVDPTKKTLDFGVGPGDILAYLKKIHHNIDYTGIDISQKFIDRLTKLFPENTFICQDIADIESGSYQQVLALEVLEHVEVPSIKKIYQNIWRILSDDGNLIISVPVYEKLEEITMCCSKCSNLENVAGHVRAYTPELLKAEVELAGFRVVDCRYVYSPATNLVKNILKDVLRPIRKDRPVTAIIKAMKIKTSGQYGLPEYKQNGS